MLVNNKENCIKWWKIKHDKLDLYANLTNYDSIQMVQALNLNFGAKNSFRGKTEFSHKIDKKYKKLIFGAKFL